MEESCTAETPATREARASHCLRLSERRSTTTLNTFQAHRVGVGGGVGGAIEATHTASQRTAVVRILSCPSTADTGPSRFSAETSTKLFCSTYLRNHDR